MIHNFNIPDIWRPSIIKCINKPIEEKKAIPGKRHHCEIVHALVVQMYSINPRPN